MATESILPGKDKKTGMTMNAYLFIVTVILLIIFYDYIGLINLNTLKSLFKL